MKIVLILPNSSLAPELNDRVYTVHHLERCPLSGCENSNDCNFIKYYTESHTFACGYQVFVLEE